MSVDREVAALATRLLDEGEVKRRARQKLVAKLLGRLDVHDAYKAVFCDDDGKITKAGLIVLRDLGEQARFGVVDPVASDAELRMNEGRRQIVLHLFERLDLHGDRALHLSTRIRELEK